MRAATCFSGIGAPETAMPHWEWLWCAEIEKFPSAVLAKRFPHSVNLGDVTAEDFMQRASAFGRLDVLAGGPPCQAFSVAGLRKSMADDRGNLSLRFVRIAHAVRPRNLVVENVPGWLNTPDNAFGCFLGAILGCDDALHSPADGKWPRVGMASGPLGRLCWATLDAQYFGVAQRRRRVFVVVDFGGGADPCSVLFEPESLCGNPAPRREKGQGTAHDIATSLTASGRGVERGGDSRGQDPVVAVNGGLTVQCADIAPPPISMCLNAGGMGSIDAESETLIPVNKCGFDVALPPEVAGTICKDSFTGGASGRPDGATVGNFLPAIAYTIEARAEVQAVAFAEPTVLMERGREGGGNLEYRTDGTANAILTPNGGRGGFGIGAIHHGWQVRRLTPTECARLQGFPDDHCAITYRGKPAADGPIYKAYGNSWAVPVGRWILERIELFMPEIAV